MVWVYVLDDAMPGSFAKAGGYIRVLPPRPTALAALREAQNVDSTGRLVEPTRFTVGISRRLPSNRTPDTLWYQSHRTPSSSSR